MDGRDTVTTQGRPVLIREDCWSEAATFTLIEAWGARYLELNRGNLRQKHWQEVADAVNARHGAVKKQRRTDVQCKNRIDTLKKKYKIEKARVSSSWAFFTRLDALLGPASASAIVSKKPSPSPPPLALPMPHRKIPISLPHSAAVRPAKVKRERSPSLDTDVVPVDNSFFRRNYSAAAAAAAASVDADSGASRSSTESRRKNEDGDDDDTNVGDGFRLLARAITSFGEIYERVEGAKQKQMIELEKKRMEFAKELEFKRIQLLMDSQVQLEKTKRAKRASADSYS